MVKTPKTSSKCDFVSNRSSSASPRINTAEQMKRIKKKLATKDNHKSEIDVTEQKINIFDEVMPRGFNNNQEEEEEEKLVQPDRTRSAAEKISGFRNRGKIKSSEPNMMIGEVSPMRDRSTEQVGLMRKKT